MVHLTGITGLDDQADLGSGALANQVVMHSGDSEQGRDGRGILVGLPVRENQYPCAVGDGLRRRRPDVVECTSQAGPTLGHRVEAADDRRTHPVPMSVHLVVGVEVDQFGQFVIAQDRVRQQDLVTGLRRRIEQVALGADGGLDAGHHLFADGVQWRVGDLSEQLLEVVEQHPWPR